jgi:uncharacterized membrane protein YfhO
MQSVERTGEDFTVVVDVRTETHLLLKESYHPGWKATLDGKPATTVHLMPSYVGVRVTPGRHEIVFRYAPGPLPAFLAAFGVVLLISFFALESRLRL